MYEPEQRLVEDLTEVLEENDAENVAISVTEQDSMLHGGGVGPGGSPSTPTAEYQITANVRYDGELELVEEWADGRGGVYVDDVHVEQYPNGDTTVDADLLVTLDHVHPGGDSEEDGSSWPATYEPNNVPPHHAGAVELDPQRDFAFTTEVEAYLVREWQPEVNVRAFLVNRHVVLDEEQVEHIIRDGMDWWTGYVQLREEDEPVVPEDEYVDEVGNELSTSTEYHGKLPDTISYGVDGSGWIGWDGRALGIDNREAGEATERLARAAKSVWNQRQRYGTR